MPGAERPWQFGGVLLGILQGDPRLGSVGCSSRGWTGSWLWRGTCCSPSSPCQGHIRQHDVALDAHLDRLAGEGPSLLCEVTAFCSMFTPFSLSHTQPTRKEGALHSPVRADSLCKLSVILPARLIHLRSQVFPCSALYYIPVNTRRFTSYFWSQSSITLSSC